MTLRVPLCNQWVKLSINKNEKIRSRIDFFGKYKMSGIVGCIDGTPIKILKPFIDENYYVNRKG